MSNFLFYAGTYILCFLFGYGIGSVLPIWDPKPTKQEPKNYSTPYVRKYHDQEELMTNIKSKRPRLYKKDGKWVCETESYISNGATPAKAFFNYIFEKSVLDKIIKQEK